MRNVLLCSVLVDVLRASPSSLAQCVVYNTVSIFPEMNTRRIPGTKCTEIAVSCI